MKSARAGSSWSGSETNKTFLNTGSGRFADVSYISGLGFKDDGRALAVTDWDGDGDLDLWSQNRTAPRLRLMRNNTNAENHSVSFLLSGTRKSNRDAIGARLKLVRSDGSALIQTLRAGNGFLSQSSRWIHFGLGVKAAPVSLQITWPDGSAESFTGLAANTRYRIGQGGKPIPVPPRTISPLPVNPEPTTPHPEPPLQGILPGKIPLPEFSYTPAGKDSPLALSKGDKPLLLVLFSGTCSNCAHELAEITRGEKRIRDGKLDVLALSIDGLSTDTDQEEAGRLLKKVGFPFSSGTVSPSSADHVRLLLDTLYDFPAPFAVPLCLLLDEERRLFAVYRGGVSPQVVLQDAGFSKAGPDQLRDLAVPFPGRWFTNSITPSALAEFTASPFHEAFPAQGLQYLKYALSNSTSLEQKARLQQMISGGFYMLARQEGAAGHHRTAETYFNETIEADPNNFEARIDFGALLGNQGKLKEAETQFRKALELSPSHEVAKRNLEVLQQQR